ncbi:MAG TPA: 2-phosphosulfolactate phosphatase, partial [Flavitalea sp.]|nr:2-phosphosulfolactate phosphatase [Flavitalea sp.]
LLHMALERGAGQVVTGSFPNLTSVCEFLLSRHQNVVLGCAAWKDRVNLEDLLFAGSVINRVKQHFAINCDSSKIAETLYETAQPDLYEFMKEKDASHFLRLTGYGLEADIRYCLTPDVANVLPFYQGGSLIVHKK